MSKMRVKYKKRSAEIDVPEFNTLREYQEYFGSREVMHLLRSAVRSSYRRKVRQLLHAGAKDIHAQMSGWKAPGELPPTPEEVQAKKDLVAAERAAEELNKLTETQKRYLSQMLRKSQPQHAEAAALRSDDLS